MTPALLHVQDLSVRYGPTTALRQITLEVEEGDALALLGPNGAGKTTLLRTLMGLVPSAGGKILLNGRAVGTLPARKRAQAGLALVPEGRRVFPGLTARENLEVAASAGATERCKRIEEVLALFPPLRSRLDARAWQLSGGEQQMLAIGRALMTRPRILLLDEPGAGLAPALVEDLTERLKAVMNSGVALLMAEQNPERALSLCRRGALMSDGMILRLQDADTLRRDPLLKPTLLG